MSDTIEIVAVIGNDWQGIYMNGLLVTQGHTISSVELLSAMQGYKMEGRLATRIVEVDDEWLCDYGFLPPSLDQVKFAK